MSLKKANGSYLKAVKLEAVDLVNKTAAVRVHEWDSEEERQDPDGEIKSYWKEIHIPETLTDISEATTDMEREQKMAYAWLKAFKEEVSRTPILDEDENETGEFDIKYVHPYADMVDC